jgi:acetyl esterase/lipase
MMHTLARTSRSLAAMTCIAAATSVASTASAQPVTPTYNDLVYGVLGTPEQPRPITLDVYIPTTGDGPFPVVIRIHGGGWQSGTNQPIAGLYVTLLQQGFAIVSPRYRLTSEAAQWAPSPVTFPAQIHDIKGAVRWVRANAAQLNLDPTRVGVCGESAGGHLSALLGVTGGVTTYTRAGATVDMEGFVGGNRQWSSRVQAVADYFGPSDLVNMNPDITTPPGGIDHDAPTSGESRLVGWDDPGQGMGDIRANLDNPVAPYPMLAAITLGASPVTHVDAGDPPFFIAHGEQDVVVPFNQSVRLRDALLLAGVPAGFLSNPTGAHAIWQAGNAAIVAFFRERLIENPPIVCRGNANADGQVTFSDVTAVLANFGRPGGIGAPGDADGNGTVNFSDITAALSSFGASCP